MQTSENETIEKLEALHIKAPSDEFNMLGDESYDSLDEGLQTEGRPERWAPLGAAQTSPALFQET